MLSSFLIPRLLVGDELAAFFVVVCFSAGLNVYATIVMLGLLSRTQILTLPVGLRALDSWYVMGICGVLFAVEFVGDKIPLFDLLWNALHTFVRVPAAAILAYAASSQMPAWQRLLATLLGALIALAAHGGKTAVRAAVTHSPEPFSNIALSVGEDVTVAFLLGYATQHPFAAAAIVALALILIAWMARVVVLALKNLFRDTEGALAKDQVKKA
jgi:hypothetical protein